MRRRDRNLFAFCTNTADAPQLRAATPLIKLNLIGFNTQRKTFEGGNKEEQDDDNPNDFVFDCTVVYDRSSIPTTLAVWQYGGREHEMLSNRSDKLLLAIYQVDTISDVVHAYICPDASQSLFYTELFAQVLRNLTQDDRSWKQYSANFRRKPAGYSYFPRWKPREKTRSPTKGTGNRIRLSVMAGSCWFSIKPFKSDERIQSPKYCFHEIPGRFWNRSVPGRIVRPGNRSTVSSSIIE
ncbi:unnamed protein product [Adineta ricciae]|uniref:Uncharacterized protein n=1 Tax=Adineta ricciae TaxID=249248 RepID=A0A814S305_ADIRI|nr:unnamed protein product [Adineta ricciae]